MEEIKTEPKEYEESETKYFISELNNIEIKHEMKCIPVIEPAFQLELKDEEVNASENIDLHNMERKIRNVKENEQNETVTHSCNEVNATNMLKRQETLSCDICNTTIKSLRRYSCNVCNKLFIQKGHLEQHTRIHTGDRPFSCEVCRKSFTQKGQLHEHLRIHTGERPFSCKHCNKSFIHKGSLNRHMHFHSRGSIDSNSNNDPSFQKRYMNDDIHIHIVDRPFVCNICNKSFLQRKDLRRHNFIHTGFRPFSCKICSKSFIEISHLKRHKLTHSGDRPFSCEICKKSFSLKDNLRQHALIHTGEKPFSCDICTKPFVRKSDLSRHISNVHK